MAYDAARQDLVDHFDPNLRRAWQNAEGAANDAEFHKALADEGLRDARKDLAEFDKGPVR